MSFKTDPIYASIGMFVFVRWKMFSVFFIENIVVNARTLFVTVWKGISA